MSSYHKDNVKYFLTLFLLLLFEIIMGCIYFILLIPMKIKSLFCKEKKNVE